MTYAQGNPGAYDPLRHWGWFAVAGVLLLTLGLYAAVDVVVATAATVLLVGTLMVVAGIAQVVVAIRADRWQETLFSILAGVFYIVAGLLAFANPILASAVITILLAVTLLASGVARIAFGLRVRPSAGWGWTVAAGVVSLIAGALIAVGWPGTIWVIGFILALDIAGQGGALLVTALALRRIHAGAPLATD
jgi:uncharacterized membrane protein HdeD (DUF308 family)